MDHIGDYKEFMDFVKDAKRKKTLHSIVEDRLSDLLSKLYPETSVVSEVAGVLGGRNDLMQFFFDGRRVVFELFFSPSQVPQDLRLLEQSSADIKIAVLLDGRINPKLPEAYFRKKPEPFPYLWLSWILLPRNDSFCAARLRELIDAEASINRLRRILSTPSGPKIEEYLRNQLEKIEQALKLETQKPKSEELSRNQLLALKIISLIRPLGIPIERLRSLYSWLQSEDVIDRVIRLVVYGFRTFLVTDLRAVYAIYGCQDVADHIFLGAENRDYADIVLCLNKTINDVFEMNGIEPVPIQWNLIYAYDRHSEIVFKPEIQKALDEVGYDPSKQLVIFKIV